MSAICASRRNFNPRPPRGGRRELRHWEGIGQSISIHAPREGGDSAPPPRPCGPWYFNPRPPRGGRLMFAPTATRLSTFQSTPPARGATAPPRYSRPAHRNFNPRPPRGGRPFRISQRSRRSKDFNPRPPRGGRRRLGSIGTHGQRISIHAPREGGDVHGLVHKLCLFAFQSTPPARGATVNNF